MIDSDNLNIDLLRIPPKLQKSKFAKNFLLVMSSSALAQVIGLVLTPIVSRLYSPADFGVFGAFSAVSSIIAAGVTLDYSQAIMLPREKEDAINLFALSCVCTLFIGLSAFVFAIFVPAFVNGLMKTKGMWALALLAVGIIVSGINQSCQAWSVRVKAFKHTSASQVIRSISSSATRIGFGYLKGAGPGLIISYILGNIIASVNLIRVLLPDFRTLRHSIRSARIKRLAREYRDFPMYSASQNIINTLSGGLPVLLFTRFYGLGVAGAYAFGINVLQAPMSFVFVALQQVLFQRASETHHQKGSLTALYIKSTGILFGLAIFPTIILIIWSPAIFTWLFGPQWHLAGELARSLIIWLAVAFCNVPAILFAKIIRIQRFVFFYDIVLLAARSLALLLGGLYLDVSKTVMLFALVGAVMNVILILWVGRCVIRKENSDNLEGKLDF